MILRWKPTEPQVTDWQWADCKKHKRSEHACRKENERESYNWEKHLMLQEYLLSDQQFTHVLMLDADAALIRADHDTLAHMADLVEREGKDILLSDEDWLVTGAG